MKYIKQTILFLMMILAFSHCNTKQDHDAFTVIGKENLKEIKSWDFEDLYENVEFVPLELTDSSVFAKVRQVIICDSSILVRATYSESSSDAKILQFGKDGKFIREMGSIGNGPGEYQSIGGMVTHQDTLFAFDAWNRCVHLYDIRNGKYINSSGVDEYDPLNSITSIIPIPKSSDFLFTSEVLFGDNTYAIAEGNPMTDKFEVVMPQKFKVDGWVSYEYATPSLCSLDEDKALALMPFNDTIYSVKYKDLDVRPFAYLNLDKPMPQFPEGELYEEAQKKVMEDGFRNLIKGIHCSEDYLVLNRTVGSVVWNISKHEGYLTLNEWDENNATSFPFIPVYIVGTSNDNTFICAYDPNSFMDYGKAIPEDSNLKKSFEKIKGLNEESNQILVIYKFK